MAIRLKRGMGAAGDSGYNPVNPDVPLAPCATQWAWAIPTCWQWPKSIIYGDKYVSSPAPPVVGSTLPDGSAIPPVPASGQAADETIQAITDQQITDWQAQNQGFFSTLNESLKSTGIPWWGWLAGAGVLAVVIGGLGSGGSARRYGR